MGNDVRFKRPPKNRGQFRGQSGWRPGAPKAKRPRRRGPAGSLSKFAVSATILLGLAGLWHGFATGGLISEARAGAFQCVTARVIDGDTFSCDGTRIRLEGIDAPELPGHCRKGRDCAPGDPYASTENLSRLVSSKTVTCRKIDTDVYGRMVARCSAGKIDLSCAQIEGGFAIRHYGMIWC